MRVANRVAKGGHDVPADRIMARWLRVMDTTLLAAIKAADEALIFDNTLSSGPLRVARVIRGEVFTFPTPDIAWPERAVLAALRADPDYAVVAA